MDFLNVLPESFNLINKNNHQADIQILDQTPASDLIRFLLDKSDIKAFEERYQPLMRYLLELYKKINHE